MRTAQGQNSAQDSAEGGAGGGFGQEPPGRLRRAAVLGHPIGHSLSPVLHTAAYQALGLAGKPAGPGPDHCGLYSPGPKSPGSDSGSLDSSSLGSDKLAKPWQPRLSEAVWQYTALDVTAEALPGFIASLDSSWAGLSLTMPLKLSIAPLLDSMTDMAQATGAVNTVLVDATGPQGRLLLTGDNTDVYGIVMALTQAGAGQASAAAGQSTVSPACLALPASAHSTASVLPTASAPLTACVLGAGATAASAVAALHSLGCLTPTVCARNLNKLDVVQALAAHPSMAGLEPAFVDLSQALDYVITADAVVSTMPAHAADQLAQHMRQAQVRPYGVLLDVVYHPRPTALQQAWTDLGGQAVGGEQMLLHQAAQQVCLMTGRQAPLAAMEAALTAAL